MTMIQTEANYFIVKGPAGMTVFKVEDGDVMGFEKLYEGRVCARGATLYSVLRAAGFERARKEHDTKN